MHAIKDKTQYPQDSNTLDEKKQFSHNEGTFIGDTPGMSWNSPDVEQSSLDSNVEPEHDTRSPATHVTHDGRIMTGAIAPAPVNDIPGRNAQLTAMDQEAE